LAILDIPDARRRLLTSVAMACGTEGHAGLPGYSGNRPLAMAPPFGDSRPVRALLIALSVIAGCTDIIGFLALDGLFAAQITGNWVLLAAHIVAGSKVEITKLLSIPIFIVTVGLTTLITSRLESIGLGSLRPLLLLQVLLLVGFLVVENVERHPSEGKNAREATLRPCVRSAARWSRSRWCRWCWRRCSRRPRSSPACPVSSSASLASPPRSRQ
jgi:Protein of unknown function (DUF1275)